jgi:hypothetical protein
LTLASNTFIDPNGDSLTYTVSGLPSWLSFNSKTLYFNGTPTEYAVYTISVTATDPWGANATMTFSIVAGVEPDIPPIALTPLVD